MKKLDEELADVIQGAVCDYVAGRPYTGVAFDIMRMGDEPSMEPVVMLLMSEDDWKTIGLMMQAIHAPNRNVRDKIYRAILDVLETESYDEDS
jgi:hypothetical protein